MYICAKYAKIQLSESGFVDGVYMVSGLTTLHWKCNRGSQTWERLILHNSLSASSSLSRIWNWKFFPLMLTCPLILSLLFFKFVQPWLGKIALQWLNSVLAFVVFPCTLSGCSLSHGCRYNDADVSTETGLQW